MAFQSRWNTEREFRGNREILKGMEEVWCAVTRIEKEAEEILNEGNPILESLGYACVHMMNACQEIEDSLDQGTESKLEPRTLAQLIDVLTRIKWTGTVCRSELIAAYQTAVREAGNSNGIHRNTIADGCTRRLDLDGRDRFLDLVEEWLTGNSKELERILKAHCDATQHGLIDDFFRNRGGFREDHQSFR